MARKQSAEAESPIELDLKGQRRDMPIHKDECRFHIFVVDTGWNAPVSRALHAHLPMLCAFAHREQMYVLTPQMSVELLRQSPELIGHDPIFLVYDRYVPQDHKANYRGFRLNLGLIRNPEQAMSRLQEFVRFVNQHREAADLERDVRHEMHRGGFDGMVRILREEVEALELL